jgi:hypothetical protein
MPSAGWHKSAPAKTGTLSCWLAAFAANQEKVLPKYFF